MKLMAIAIMIMVAAVIPANAYSGLTSTQVTKALYAMDYVGGKRIGAQGSATKETHGAATHGVYHTSVYAFVR